MDTLSIRIVFDQKGQAKKNPKKKAMIYIEIRDKKTNQKTYIPTNVKILFEHYYLFANILCYNGLCILGRISV